MKILMVGLTSILLLSSNVMAESAVDKVWLNFGGISKHLGNAHRKFNEVNNGFGLEADIKDYTVSAGVYSNSIGKESRYFAVEKMFLQYKEIKFGLSAGVVDGYEYKNGAPFPVVLPSARWDGETVGVRALFIPPVDDLVTAAVAIQFRVVLK